MWCAPARGGPRDTVLPNSDVRFAKGSRRVRDGWFAKRRAGATGLVSAADAGQLAPAGTSELNSALSPSTRGGPLLSHKLLEAVSSGSHETIIQPLRKGMPGLVAASHALDVTFARQWSNSSGSAGNDDHGASEARFWKSDRGGQPDYPAVRNFVQEVLCLDVNPSTMQRTIAQEAARRRQQRDS